MFKKRDDVGVEFRENTDGECMCMGCSFSQRFATEMWNMMCEVQSCRCCCFSFLVSALQSNPETGVLHPAHCERWQIFSFLRECLLYRLQLLDTAMGNKRKGNERTKEARGKKKKEKNNERYLQSHRATKERLIR